VANGADAAAGVRTGGGPLPGDPRREAQDRVHPAGVVAISQQHKDRGFESPTAQKLVREVVTEIARTNGSAQRQKRALTADVLAPLPKTLTAPRCAGSAGRSCC
jgi:hypothetical protein